MKSLRHHVAYKPKKDCGCGSENALIDFVPDTIFFLSIRSACCIHDDRYRRGGLPDMKAFSDKEFLDNMLTIISNYKKWWYPHFLARHRAMTYYNAVVEFGDDSFNFKGVT